MNPTQFTPEQLKEIFGSLQAQTGIMKRKEIPMPPAATAPQFVAIPKQKGTAVPDDQIGAFFAAMGSDVLPKPKSKAKK